MPTPILIPAAGESVTEATLSRWARPDGALVARDEVIAEIETDKVNMELLAPEAGVLRHRAKVGDVVKVGAAVAEVDPSGVPTASAAPAAAKAAEGAGEPRGAVATAPPPAAAPLAPPATPTVAPPAPSTNGHAGDVRATPLAERLAKEYGVDLARIVPTGAGQRVREQDVIAFIQSRQTGAGAPEAPASPASPAAKRERMSPLRQRIAQRLVEAQHTAAMLTTFNEVDMTNVMALRSRHKEAFEKKHGVGLGFMSFFVKAACSALRAFPTVNAFIVTDEEGRPAVETHDSCDVSIAVSTPKGLVVPVLRGADRLSFAGIEKGIKDFAERAKTGKLELAELSGGTFTITNGGVFGSLMSTPILNPPQSGILGMHTIKNRAVENPDRPGEVALRPMMYLALSYDHRLVDGAQAVGFLVHVKQCIEDPAKLLLD
ncbi:MAG: 2-oxoglutarate dehydrogenase complex dihydrolipoyllysine-residue succinyltransferase [Phycisphaerales bacterium]|nr:2-oxoglutarate dehydrogenase complex dihydrolipoyllysine-residue succinyltransferase [Phycisphaerales bacterium]